ncbi:hypothetical protein Q9R20_10110 [Microbacterium sp. PRF11]|uniref:hypothetical protein n=1 Tax=Microbacterium sp. PRF11 TaxID=2962593 RepID=UPI00288141CA|nr:hypothetical protein [Microbacterium sp. PRF11]MDT0117344.1 hypothetical protein [Microbacterium sp. PRF11]
MPNDLTIKEARRAIYTRSQLVDRDVASSELRRANGLGALARLQRDAYVARAPFTELLPSAQHRLRVVAAAEQMRGGAAIVSHLSAAVLHDLPLYRFVNEPIRVTLAGGRRASSRPGLRRHRGRLDDEDVVEIDGILCTSVDRTVFDVARTSTFEAAVACADGAVRREVVEGRAFDPVAQEAWRDRLAERAQRTPGARGIVRARRVIASADGRAESVGESVSRVQFLRLGYAVEPQVPVAGPRGSTYFADLALPDHRVFWEFDGAGKYTDPRIRGDKSADLVLLEEKRREDWIRATTGWKVCRGGFRDIGTPEALAARLAAFGVEPAH